MSKPEQKWRSWEGRFVEGKFPLRQWLGGSDHSAVFLTEFAGQPSQRTAIKLIQTDEGGADGLLSRLEATRKLSHPHLIRIFECGRCRVDGSPFLFALMECADDDLSQILPERPLAPQEVSDLLPPVLDALAYLHRNGFVHSRVKPSNVLATGDQLKLSSDQAARVEQQRTLRRRDVYDAPETAAGIISPSADIWSVGVTLVAALTQTVSVAESASAQTGDLPATIPEPFRGIVRECLQPDPNRRASLELIQARIHPSDVRAVAAPPHSLSQADSGRHRPLWIALTLILIVLGIVLALFHSRSNNTPERTEATKQPAAGAAPPSAVPAPSTAKPTDRAAKPRKTGGEVVRKVLPDVPRSAQNTIRGTIKVVVRVQVDASGKVSSAKLQTRGSSRYFANQALKAAQRWEFSAPDVEGQPSTSAWLLQFTFKRKSIQAMPQRVRG